MNLNYELLTEPVEINLGDIVVISIENIHEYKKIITGIITGNLNFKFYEDGEILHGKFVEIIDNILSLNFNDRKVIAKVLKSLEDLVNIESQYNKTISLREQINEYVLELAHEADLPLSISDELDFQSLFKAVGVEVINTYDTLIEVLINYIDLMLLFKDTKIFVFYNLFLYLSEEDLQKLKIFAIQQDICIVDIERYILDIDTTDFKIILFDKDLCRVR